MSSSPVISTKFVVVGGGIAGISCIETLSFHCPTESIVLLTESPLIKSVTNLIALGKLLSRFDIEERHVSSLPQNVRVVTDRLKEIDSLQNIIITENNQRIEYEYLCLCTGGRPKLIEQLSEENRKFVLGIRDTESVNEFQRRIQDSRKIVVVGNGGIASELVYELKNVEIDWVIKDKFVSQTFIDPGAATFFADRIHAKTTDDQAEERPRLMKRMRYEERVDSSAAMQSSGAALGPDWHTLFNLTGKMRELPSGVRIHCDTEIESITAPAAGAIDVNVVLQNGDVIDCDFVVSATGVVPNINFSIVGSEFRLGPDGGIFVSELMETSVKNVYAAGDICYAGWEWTPHWFQMRLWTQARQMGGMAGKSMAARANAQECHSDFCFELFGHVTQLFGYQVVLLGNYNGQKLDNKYEALLRVTQGKEYIKYVMAEGRLHGAILIGDTGLEETTENLILNQLDLSPYGDDILNPDIDIEDYFD